VKKGKDKKVVRISAHRIGIIVGVVWIITVLVTVFGTNYVLSLKNTSLSLLNPRIATLSKESAAERNKKLFTTLFPLKEKILAQKSLDQKKVAFYVEDLNSGSWIGLNERDPFIPASLLKVPIAIGVMKKVDNGQWSLNTTFTLESRYKDKLFGDLYKQPDGTKLTIRQLLEEMLVNSDNTAAALLFDKLSKGERDDVYYQMGSKNPEIESADGKPTFSQLSPKDLATMFRALYNATYLEAGSSNYLLEMLTRTEFDKDVQYRIPEKVKIAHKIGVFQVNDPKAPRNSHDCGIVYVPEHPFLYCIMTKDMEVSTSEKTILDTRYEIYKYFTGAK
jgi:beta-lactamase class A